MEYAYYNTSPRGTPGSFSEMQGEYNTIAYAMGAMLDTMSLRRDRILALDLLRGYFIVVIIIDHFGWFTTFFEPFTGDGLLWASAAEGFFTISGMLVGYIYGPKILAATKVTVRRLWRRAAVLYILFIASTLLLTLFAKLIVSPHIPGDPWHTGSIGSLVTSTLTLQYFYGLNDFLSRYALFMLASPVILLLLARFRRVAPFVVVTFSILFWLFLQPLAAKSAIASILIWQIIFVPSIVLGFYLPQIEQWFKNLNNGWHWLLLTGLFGITIVTYIISYASLSLSAGGLVPVTFYSLHIDPTNFMLSLQSLNTHLAPYTDKLSLGVMRLAIGALWFWSLYILVRRFENSINNVTRGFFAFMGRNSLTAYIVHAFVLFFVAIAIQSPSTGRHFLYKTFVTILIISVITGLTWLFAARKKIFAKLLR